MNGGVALGLVMAMMALAVVVVGLTRRRLPRGRLLRIALLWAGIIVVATAIAALGRHIRPLSFT